MRGPAIWELRDLYKHCTDGPQSSSGGGEWVPARPIGLVCIKTRLRAAWLVLTGRADAVVWPQDQ